MFGLGVTCFASKSFLLAFSARGHCFLTCGTLACLAACLGGFAALRNYSLAAEAPLASVGAAGD